MPSIFGAGALTGNSTPVHGFVPWTEEARMTPDTADTLRALGAALIGAALMIPFLVRDRSLRLRRAPVAVDESRRHHPSYRGD